MSLEQYKSKNFAFSPSSDIDFGDVLYFWNEYDGRRKKITFRQDEGWVKSKQNSLSPVEEDYIIGVISSNGDKIFKIFQGRLCICWKYRKVQTVDILL